ncbi:MAG: glycosyltransferase family 9 protein, partial [Chlorobi bacterium]|nr:glycosyltransferase family 9 protein [Chlorobiota bacterium]
MRHRAKQIELYIRRRFLAYSRKPFSGELITKPKNVLLSDSPRILLLRQDRLGDVICSTPIVAALRQHFPTARIDLLLSHNNIALAELMYNWCNRLWCYNKTVASFLFLRHQLRRQHYDAVVDLMDNPSTTSTLFVRSIRAPIRIGIIKDNAWVYTHCVPLLDRERHHYIERIAQLLLPFGIDPSSVNLFPLYPLTHSDIAQAATALNLEHFPDRSGFVLVHISTRHTPLQWGWDRYHAVVAHLRAQLPELPIGIGSTPEDRTVAEAIAHQTGAFLLPHLSFHQYAAIVHFARLLISPDTAIVHAAAAMHIPSVVLYHQGNPALMPWYPYGAPYRALVV